MPRHTNCNHIRQIDSIWLIIAFIHYNKPAAPVNPRGRFHETRPGTGWDNEALTSENTDCRTQRIC